MLQVSENEVKNRLRFDNPWWERQGSVEDRFRKLPKREYFKRFYELLVDRSVNRAIILMGPRRVGKTVMVHHGITQLLDAGEKADSILYLSLETPIYTGLSLEKILNLFLTEYAHTRSSKLTICFDEIQYLRDWEVHLKSLVDSYPDFKFIATGSAAAALRLKSRESGAGRFTEFTLPPLTFSEYLGFIAREDELIGADELHEKYFVKDIDELNKEFVNYLNYGGYPEAVFSETIRSDSARYIKSDIVDKVLLRDLPSLYGVSDIQELNRLFTVLAYNTGNEISLEGLSQSSGVAKNTLKRYLEYLEAAFLIKRIHRVDENAQHFTRATSFKVYLTNPSMRAALFGYIGAEDLAIGSLAETAIYSQWFHSDFVDQLYYARWKRGEVDIVALSQATQKPVMCIEVKWTDRVLSNHDEISGVIEFLKNNNIREISPVVTTRTKEAGFFVKGIFVQFIPTAIQAYRLSKNIMNYKNS
jgi:uncharacterized protein